MLYVYMDVSEIVGFPQIIHLKIGFSIIFTIHFGVFSVFLETPISTICAVFGLWVFNVLGGENKPKE